MDTRYDVTATVTSWSTQKYTISPNISCIHDNDDDNDEDDDYDDDDHNDEDDFTRMLT